jgi:hypothetical protein
MAVGKYRRNSRSKIYWIARVTLSDLALNQKGMKAKSLLSNLPLLHQQFAAFSELTWIDLAGANLDVVE